jgi:hypothetical protein
MSDPPFVRCRDCTHWHSPSGRVGVCEEVKDQDNAHFPPASMFRPQVVIMGRVLEPAPRHPIKASGAYLATLASFGCAVGRAR